MKRKLIVFLAIILAVSLVILTGCGDSKVEKNDMNSTKASVDNEQEQNKEDEAEKNQSTKNEIEEEQVEVKEDTPKDPKQKIIDAWFKLPTNLDYSLQKDYSDGSTSIQKYSKRGNDFLLELEGDYYYYKYKDNNIWTSYEYGDKKGWDSYYYEGCIITTPGSSEQMMLKKLDNYTTEHEKFNVEGVGEVDTVIGKDGDDTYYYSEDLGINVKITTKNITLIVTKFDKNVTDYPHSIPSI